MEEWRNVVGFEGVYEVGNFAWRFAVFSFEQAIKEHRVTMMREKVAQLSQAISTLEQELA